MGWGRILSITLVLGSGSAAAQAPWPTQQQPQQQQQQAWPAQQQSQGQQGQKAWPGQQPQQQQQASWPSQQQQAPAQGAWPAQQAAMPAAPMMPPGGGMAPGGGAPHGAGMMSPMGPGGGQAPPCFTEFTKLRTEVEKHGAAAKAANEQHVAREELCKVFTNLSSSMTKWARFTAAKAKECGIPPDAVKQIKGQDEHLVKLQKTVCSGGGPAAPSLAEALGTDKLPLDDIENEKKKVKRGGVLDSLTGAPIR
jgi:hypothetical protein